VSLVIIALADASEWRTDLATSMLDLVTAVWLSSSRLSRGPARRMDP
jgi:hypothetical protein